CRPGPAAGFGRGTPGAVGPRLEGFDSYMAQVLRDWNVPGIGVGIVVKDKLVFAKGYGYRDYGKKLPFTPATTQPIASNTKLFTAVAAGAGGPEGAVGRGKTAPRIVPRTKSYNTHTPPS